MNKLKINPQLQDLELGTFRLNLNKVTAIFNQQPITIKRVQTLFLYHLQEPNIRQPMELLLAAEFTPEGYEVLKEHFLLMAQSPPHGEGQGYEFLFKPAALTRYGGEFTYAQTLNDWLSIGPGALLDFLNYECIGRFDFNEEPPA